jgi:hypothetical protein
MPTYTTARPVADTQTQVLAFVKEAGIWYSDLPEFLEAGLGTRANLMMVGVAAQRGWLPVGIAAIERAIELNAVQGPFNLRAFRLGRLWAHDPATVMRMLTESGALPAPLTPSVMRGPVLDRAARKRAGYTDSFLDAFEAFSLAHPSGAPSPNARPERDVAPTAQG